MKRILIAALALLMVISMCACGNNSEAQKATADTKPVIDAGQHIESLIDADKYTRESGNGYTARWVSKDNATADFSDVLTLDKDEITIGKTTFADISKLGFEIDKNAPESIPIGKSVEIPIVRDDQSCSLFTSVNTTDKAVKLADITVGGFYITPDAYAHFSYNGATESSTLEDILSQEGMPVHNIDVTVRGNTTLEYLTYNKESSIGDTPLKVTMNIGAVLNGDTSKISYIHYLSETVK